MTGPGRSEAGRCIRFRARLPSWSAPFVRRVAEALAALPPGEAVLAEQIGRELPTIVAASAVSAWAVRSASAGLPGELETIDGLPGGSAVARRGARFGVVRAAAPPGPTMPPTGSEANLEVGPGRAGTGRELLRSVLPEAPWLEGAEPPPRALQTHWWSTGSGRLAVRIRLAVPASDGAARLRVAAGQIGRRLGSEVGGLEIVRPWSARAAERAWRSGRLLGLSSGPALELLPGAAATLLLDPPAADPFDGEALTRHLAIVGASGSGKSSFLTELARSRIEAGGSVVLLDIHGEIAPTLTARLSDSARTRLVGIDLAAPTDRIPGLALFRPGDPTTREREAAHLVVSLRHLSSEGEEVYWGVRLEQIFDVVVRLAEEEDGGFAAIYELLTDPRRREAARLTTRRPVAARFLDELPTLLRRNPDYLQGAVARVQKLLLQPKLARLFVPAEPPIELDRLVEAGRSILLRLPIAELGPSASRFAASLVASRVYLALAALGGSSGRLRTLLVVDEAQAIAPSLLAELLSEGRKFGIGLAVATQYPERLAPDARRAAEGAAGGHLVFGVPRSSAAAAGLWVGLERDQAERLLPELPAGVGVLDGAMGASRRLVIGERPSAASTSAWEALCDRTADEFRPSTVDPSVPVDPLEEAILLTLVAAADRGAPTGLDELRRALRSRDDGQGRDGDLEAILERLAARRWIVREDDGYLLTVAGSRGLGLGASSGAASESDAHRALLVAAFRIFARHGERMEIVRQGRFDTRLPDGRLRLLEERGAAIAPRELAERLRDRQASWLWRAFGGRDLFVEAEVSGADRRERIRRGLTKARAAGASVVFLVGDAARARKVRRVIREEKAAVDEAQVWTLRPHGRPLGQPLSPTDR